MGKAERNERATTFDGIEDELMSEEERAAFDAEEAGATVEPDGDTGPEPDAPEAPATTDETTAGAADAEAEPPEQTPPPAPPSTEAPGVATTEEPAAEPSLQEQLATAEKAREGLQAELAKTRLKLRGMAGQQPQGVQATPAQPVPPQPGQPVPVTQADNGGAGTGIVFEGGVPRVDPDYIREQVRAATAPDPQVQAAQRAQNMRMQFVSEGDDPTLHARAFDRADEAVDVFQTLTQSVAQENGIRLDSVSTFLDVAKQGGVMARMEAAYPDVAPFLEEFAVAGSHPDSELSMKIALRRFASTLRVPTTDTTEAVPPRVIPPAKSTAPQALPASRPPSLAGVGEGSTGDQQGTDTARAEALEQEMVENPFAFGSDPKKRAELERLQKKLGLA